MTNHTSLTHLKSAAEKLLDLFYPNLCLSCERKCDSSRELFCLECQYHIHPTLMHEHSENEFTAHFKGRIAITGGAALYYYIKGGRLQQAMEGLKYRNRPDIGLELGRFYGMLLRDHDPYRQAQLILPVPLHPKRKAQRGYNQSAMVAQGLFESMGIPFREDLLVRKKETNSQTEKNRMDRVVNMQSAFELRKPELLKNQHLLLVDDILTTGATLEACARLLTRVEGTRISLVTLAMTK